MTASPTFPRLKRGLVAILRGIEPAETEAIVGALVEEGFEAAEIPLNSPDPFASIRIAVERFGARCLIGAGTVLRPDEVDALADCGGRLMVSPNVNPEVLARAAARGLVTMPGVFTATEALAALEAGASALKMFPASVLGPAGVAALRAVLPKATIVGAVGGVGEGDFAAYAKAGVSVFGLGSSLYKPGDGADAVRRCGRAAIAAYDAAFAAP